MLRKSFAAAYSAIPACFRDTPCFAAPSLSQQLGCTALVKVESINPIRSFKGRGCSWLFTSRDFNHNHQVVCASAGNFGQGIAFAAAKTGTKATVFAPENANPLKIEMMKLLGAEVQLHGKDFDAAKEIAAGFASETGATFIVDGQEPELAEGAGTIALEALQSGLLIDIVVAPLGNGSLLGGIAHCVKTHRPEIEVVGVCAEGAPAMELSYRAKKAVATDAVDTIADGIAVRTPVAAALPLLDAAVDEVKLVSDQTLRDAIRTLYRSTGIVAEPAGVAAIAAVMAYPLRFKSKRILLPICGSNISNQLSQELLR